MNDKKKYRANDVSEFCRWDTEISSLAEQNSPLLIKMAKSYAPTLFSTLYKLQPNLVHSELIFCIYLKLNFTTKEISKFLNVTPKAIQNRKNRLRKKLNIPSETDIYVWFDNI